MKKMIRILLLINICLVISGNSAMAQCDPLGSDQCPDPENNGEVCPDSFAPGNLNQPYSVVATILPPPAIDTLGFQITINHITLDSVLNLPPGLTWTSNATDNEFYPGTYYCILMDGTPTVADTFHLKIYIGIFVEFFGDTLQVTQIVDSTSLSMIILDNTGIAEFKDPDFHILDNSPNPFSSWTSIRYYAGTPGPVEFELYNLMGTLIDKRTSAVRPGENYFYFLGEGLKPGTYYYLLKSDGRTAGGKIVRSQ